MSQTVLLKQPPIKIAETAEEVEQLAIDVSGNEASGKRWFVTPNQMLGWKTPKQAVADGQGKLASGILYNIAGI